MAEEADKSGEPAVQVMVVPQEAMESVAKFLRDQGPRETKGSESGSGVSGTGCRFTTHGDLHCGDTDHV